MSLRLILYGIRALGLIAREFSEPASDSYEDRGVHVTCPHCHKMFEFNERGKAECVFCGWKILVGQNGTIVRGQSAKFTCLKCSTLLEYNDLDTVKYCLKCYTLHTIRDNSLVISCPKCKGTGKTGLFNKTVCSKCDGLKELVAAIS